MRRSRSSWRWEASGGKAEAFLFAGDVLRERDGGGFGRSFAETFADDEFLRDNAKRERIAGAEDGLSGFVEFGQAGERAAAESERVRRRGEWLR